MRFVDRARILVRAGDGGDGAVAWRREAHVARGGPAGGDGGRGGDVVLEADEGLGTLLDAKVRQHFVAASGARGQSKGRHGRGADDLVIRVPTGTVVYYEGEAGPPGSPPPWKRGEAGPDEGEIETVWIHEPDDLDEGHEPDAPLGEPLFDDDVDAGPGWEPHWSPGDVIGDLSETGQRLVVARGGRGGAGNLRFRSSRNRAPDYAQPGGTGQALWIRLELKLLADVGIVGFPNVGKSTLIRAISHSRAEVGAYPFTTLVPQLGVVSLSGDRSMVVADVPGLVRGASEGKGLGHQFLRHLERTRVLLHVLAPDPDDARSPLADLEALEDELTQYGDMFEGRPRVVALNKIDTPEGESLVRETRQALRARDIPLFAISAHTGAGVDRLLEALWRRLQLVRHRET